MQNDSTDLISYSELRFKMREALSNVTLPEAKLPTVPDINTFQLPPILPGNNCNGNTKAISLDIDDKSGGLDITICTFLEFELNGQVSTNGLLDYLDVSIGFELDSGYVLKGALSTGIKITVTSLEESPLLQLDPIFMQLNMQEGISGSANFGLLKATISGDALLEGQVSLGYCTSCNGTYLSDDYQKADKNSPFYYSRNIAFDVDAGLELSASAYGVELDMARDRIRIKDDDAFDEIPPSIQLPDAQSLRDSIKFSPQNAVSKSVCMIFWFEMFELQLT